MKRGYYFGHVPGWLYSLLFYCNVTYRIHVIRKLQYSALSVLKPMERHEIVGLQLS